MISTLEVIIRPGGDLEFIYDDRLAPLLEAGQSEVMRASHVEPDQGGWSADLSPVGGPILGPFPLRNQALNAEVAWLKNFLESGPRT